MVDIGKRWKWRDGYRQIGRKSAHVVKVERILGKSLPRAARVHHANGNGRDDSNQNLVVCENHAYHMLMHYRQRIVDAGGNPDTQKVCSICRVPVDYSGFTKKSGRHGRYMSACKLCINSYRRLRGINKAAWSKAKSNVKPEIKSLVISLLSSTLMTLEQIAGHVGIGHNSVILINRESGIRIYRSNRGRHEWVSGNAD